MGRLLITFAILLALIQIVIEGYKMKRCNRDYDKIGCFEEKANTIDLLVNDRAKIKWKEIESYMHHLACLCSEAAKAANKNRLEPYAGFALHYYGECYGRTKAHMEALMYKDQSHRCVGNQSYTTCEAHHMECVGAEHAEYIYKFKDSTIKNLNGGYSAWASWTACTVSCGTGIKMRERTCTHPEPKGRGKDCSSRGPATERAECNTGKKCPKWLSSEFEKRACEGESISIECKGDAKIVVTNAMFGRLSLEYCKPWYGDDWRTDCTSSKALSKVKRLCERKSSCLVYSNTGIFGDPCKNTGKYLEIKYRCKSRERKSK